VTDFALIEAKREQLHELCIRYAVRRLELFGSAVRGDMTAQSDLDFLVEFGDIADGAHADHYFGLLFALEALFGRPVDLVMTEAVENPYFLAGVNRSRTVLYAAA